MPAISQRGVIMPSSPIRKLVPYSDAAKARGLRVFHLNIGQPDILTPEVALSAVKNAQIPIVEYTHSAGMPEYRRKLSKYYKSVDINISPDEMLITCGGSEAVMFAFMSCLDPLDEIIIPEPFYANYEAFAAQAGALVKPITSTIETGFTLPSIEEFEKELIKSYASQQLLDFLVTESLVLEYPKAEYKLIKKSISDMELDFAAQYGMGFDTYLKTYLGFESRDAYIKYTMKMEMAYYAYAQKLGIAPTEADIATARAELIENYKAQYMSSSSKLTEAEALEYATSFVDESLTESDLYQEALYKLVGDHLETQYVLKEVATTYTSVSKGGSLFDE